MERQTADDLVAVCDHCLTPIPDGAGVLEIDIAAADRALRRWRVKAGPDPLAVYATTPGARPVRWSTRHHDCGRPPRSPYTITVERIRTWPGLLHWGSHLADKYWLPATDWHDLTGRAIEPLRAAVSGILPAHPRDPHDGPVGDRPR
ncbi:hypothetical protein ACFRMQ_11105 [Kitasatospora sp. NPDC056783]|uniref:hypothetical protein n=1 Tax=Kitasatospora sp. NPDC056783 TaxID=3345943 RepID=UPI0036AA0E28